MKNPPPGRRVGLLIVRAWIEGPDERLIARITHTPDLAEHRPATTVVRTVGDIYAEVREWLDGLQVTSDPNDDA